MLFTKLNVGDFFIDARNKGDNKELYLKINDNQGFNIVQKKPVYFVSKYTLDWDVIKVRIKKEEH